MKKILSLFIAIAMMAGMSSLQVLAATEYASPDSDGYYLNADFENGVNPFNVVTNSVADAGTVGIVNSTTDAVIGSGNALKISSTGRNVITVAAPLATPISLEKPIVFEARFMNAGTRAAEERFFSLSSKKYSNRNRAAGLANLKRPQNINSAFETAYDYSVAASGGAVLMNPTDSTTPMVLAEKTWYRIKIVYDETGTKTMIKSLQLFDNSDNLIQSVSNCETVNSGYPLDDISEISFNIQDVWDKAHILYLDDVKVYEEPDALAVANSFSGIFAAGVKTISIPFNKSLNDDTLDSISIVGVNAATPEIESATVVDDSTLTINLKDTLIGSATYQIDLSGLKAVDGSELEETTIVIHTEEMQAEGVYLNADFENGVNPFKVVTNTVADAGTVGIVNSTTDAVIGSGNALKIFSTGRNVITAAAQFTTPISLEKPVVFEARFMNAGTRAAEERFFSLSSKTYSNRNRAAGLANLKRPQNINSAFETAYDYSVAASGGAVLMNPTDSTKPMVLAEKTWYRIKIVYDETGEKTMIKSLQLFDNNDTLIQSVSNCETVNSTYPLEDISEISFNIQDVWNAEHILYLDDVKVYDEPDALSFISASITDNAEVSPVETDSVTFAFSERIDSNSIDEFVVKADNVNVAYSAKLIEDSTKVKVTFTGGLLGGKNYTVDYSAIKDINGSSVNGILSFRTKSGLFIKNIEANGTISAGATISGVVNFYNATDSSETVSVIAAVYEKVGNAFVMTNVSTKIDETVAVGNAPVTINIAVPSDATVTNTSVRIFVLESMSTLKPLISAKEIN